jgi:DNA adenine methylase
MNVGLIRMYRALQECPFAVCGALSQTPYNAEIFGTACHRIANHLNTTDLNHAVSFIVKNRFSRGGLGKDFAWSDRLRGGQPGDVNAWQTIVNELPAIAARLDRVTMLVQPAREVIEHADDETLIYADPPYLHETRTTKKAYDHEMTRADHEALLAALVKSPAMVFLSGYKNDLYDSALAGWTRHEFEIANHSGQGKSKQRRVECLWTNVAP